MDLKTLFYIQEVLKESGYYDISRISKEIFDFSQVESVELELILDRIRQQEPWEYIRGYAYFRGERYIVNRNTLIPRIETEQLVDIAISLIKENSYSKVFDIGTGTGCIIISLAKEIDNRENRISFVATDISTHALDIAKQNASNLKVKNINFKSENLINKSWLSNESLIIANLPYIPSKMYQELEPSVKDYEPKIALEGGRDGLSYYKKLFSIIEKSEKEVDLLIEIEPTTLSAFKKILENKQIKKIYKDYRGKKRFLLIHFS
ncbi:peptide chain release factor N(5)-glutamine methyltransferase [Candidatus Dojkabacteria bacterium]|uniref:Peptide chain release factor N(5)-glutamine methyltransferase n=1 Tax=Candidatus Dojkabacteria bacterium TaxID=2099670 RepID=A0A847D1I3_9BACT|nr:peptide chain release factor N(5)-glutamine methyltransferase [Candidatus Dojkabacteria bacterium]